MHCATQKHALARGSPYTCPLPPLITRHITRRRLCPTHAYIRVDLLHPQGMINFSQEFLHTLSQVHYWLERQSANVPACRYLSFHHENSTPPYWKSLPPHRSIICHRCHSSVLTEQIKIFTQTLKTILQYIFLIPQIRQILYYEKKLSHINPSLPKALHSLHLFLPYFFSSPLIPSFLNFQTALRSCMYILFLS